MSLATFHEAQARYPYNTVNGYDYLAWAKRIIYRHERGDKTLTISQIKNAQEAMSVKTPTIIF